MCQKEFFSWINPTLWFGSGIQSYAKIFPMTEMTCIFSMPRLESTKKREGVKEQAKKKKSKHKSQNKPFMAPMRAQEVFQQALAWQIGRRRGYSIWNARQGWVKMEEMLMKKSRGAFKPWEVLFSLRINMYKSNDSCNSSLDQLLVYNSVSSQDWNVLY